MSESTIPSSLGLLKDHWMLPGILRASDVRDQNLELVLFKKFSCVGSCVKSFEAWN